MDFCIIGAIALYPQSARNNPLAIRFLIRKGTQIDVACLPGRRKEKTKHA